MKELKLKNVIKENLIIEDLKQRLLKESIEHNLYEKEDYTSNPKEYCGITINDNPYYDLH